MGGSDHRATDITTGSDDQVRIEFIDDPARLSVSLQEIHRRLEILPQLFSVESADGNKTEFVSVFRNKIFLHPPFGPDKQDLRIRMFSSDLIGNAMAG